MKISITVQNLSSVINLSINDETNEAILNGNEIQIDVSAFVSKLVAIVSSWEKEMINNLIVDGESYSVKIENQCKTYKYVGRNKFPINYRDFKKLISSLSSVITD